MTTTLDSAIATFGASAKEKLSNPAAAGQPEDQLRAPFEHLLADMAELSRLPKSALAAVGESSVSDLKTRPDYAITVHNALSLTDGIAVPPKRPERAGDASEALSGGPSALSGARKREGITMAGMN